MSVWTIKGGSWGEYEADFLDEGIVGLDYGFEQSVAEFIDRDALRSHVENQTGADQLWRFYQDVKIGDTVVLPRKLAREVAVGRISGPYVYQPDAAEDETLHTRRVEWLAVDIPRTNFDRDLLNSFGAMLTLSQPSASNAEARIKQIVNVYLKVETAPARETGTIPYGGSVGVDEGEEGTDFEAEIRYHIVKRLRRRFAGTRLEYLVASILRASGYVVLQTREGADGGIDLLAGKGDMGFGEPHLCVQVKGRMGPVDLAEYDRLRGSINTFGAQHGLLVSLGGFTKPVHDRNEQQFFAIRLWNAEDLAQRLLDNYDSLPQDIRAEIPLEEVRVLRLTD